MVRGITYYKAGQAGAAEGPAGSRGESPGRGRGAGGTLLPWCCSAGRRAGGCPANAPTPRLISLQRAPRGGRLRQSGRKRGAPRRPQPRGPRPKPSCGQRPPCPAPRLRPAPPWLPAPPPAAPPPPSLGRGLTALGALKRQTEVGERGCWEGAPASVVPAPVARLGQQ